MVVREQWLNPAEETLPMGAASSVLDPSGRTRMR